MCKNRENIKHTSGVMVTVLNPSFGTHPIPICDISQKPWDISQIRRFSILASTDFVYTKSKQELSLSAVQELPPLTPQNIINQHKIR